MNQEEILEELEKLLSDLSISVRYEKGDFSGGLYRYREKHELVVNKNLAVEQKIAIIAAELKNNMDLDSIFLVPALREVIENASSMG